MALVELYGIHPLVITDIAIEHDQLYLSFFLGQHGDFPLNLLKKSIVMLPFTGGYHQKEMQTSLDS